jgi:ribonuclease D
MNFTFIDSQEEFEAICDQLSSCSWIGLDTEFIGENSYYTELCLIQISSDRGIFLFDPLKINVLDSFVNLLVHPAILKITHAGENDFKIFFEKFGITPVNVFDTQLACGFVGYRFPISFRELVGVYIGTPISKAYSIVDWKKRPLPTHFIQYAVKDVEYLFQLYTKISEDLKRFNRENWFMEESIKFETPAFYEQDPHKDFRKSQLVDKLDTKHRLFLLRLFNWRNKKAKELNTSKEFVLQSKQIPFIIKSISAGKSSLDESRRIPDGLIKKYMDDWEYMFNAPADDSELELIGEIASNDQEPQDLTIKYDLIYTAIQLHCFQNNISIDLVLPRSLFKELKSNFPLGSQNLKNTWRSEFLGEAMIQLFSSLPQMNLTFEPDKLMLG